MLHFKQASPPLKDLSESDLTVKLNELLIKIHVCTGWNPPAQEYLDVFFDQFIKKISESYFYFNADEIEYAFRHYGKGVKEWGKNMNIAIIDQVMDLFIKDINETCY